MASLDDSAILTVVKPAMSPRWFWAITKVVASFLGPLMRMPVVMLNWVLLGRLIVFVRFYRAMKEESFVLTEHAPKFHSFSWHRAIAPLLRPSHFWGLPRLARHPGAPPLPQPLCQTTN